MSIQLLLIICICLIVMFITHKYFQEEKEGFLNLIDEPICEYPKNEYFTPIPSNPFGNLLLTDIGNVEKKPAGPSFNKEYSLKIEDSLKKMIKNNNPHLDKKIDEMFGNYYDKFIQDDGFRVFYTTASNQFVSNQPALAQFLGPVVSRKGYTADDYLLRQTVTLDGSRSVLDTENTDIPVRTS